MTSDPPRSTTPSAIGRTLGALGDEWSLLIVRAALWGANRFGEFRERLGISDSVLASRLGDLVDFEVLSVDETGCYRLTDSGEGLWRVLAAIWSWERGWVDGQDAALPEMWHRQCRQMIGLEVRCAACGQTAGWGDVSIGEVEPATFARLLPPGTRRRRRRRRAPSADPDPQGGDPLHRDPLRLDPLRLGQYQATMTLIGSRWSAAHFGALLLGARRFGEVARLTGATPKVVSERLGAFVELGALRAGEDGYELTEMGEAFFVVVAPFVAWALTHRSAPDETPLSVTHTGCGEPFVPLLCCDACGGEIAVGDLLSPAGSADGRRVPR